MKRRLPSWGLLLIPSLMLIGWPFERASAGGLEVSPAFFELAVDATIDQSLPIQLTVTNGTETRQQLTFEVVDATKIEPLIWQQLFGHPSVSTRSGSLVVDWKPATTTIDPKETLDLTGVVRISPDLPPGNHELVLTVRPTSFRSTEQDIVVVQHLLLPITVSNRANAILDGKVSIEGIDTSWSGLPRAFHVSVTNTGNVPLTPRGVVVLVEPWDRQLASEILNQTSEKVFPGEVIQFELPLRVTRLPVLPGFHELSFTSRLTDGSEEETVHLRTGFVWTLPMLVTGFVGAGWFFWLWRRRSRR